MLIIIIASIFTYYIRNEFIFQRIYPWKGHIISRDFVHSIQNAYFNNYGQKIF